MYCSICDQVRSLWRIDRGKYIILFYWTMINKEFHQVMPYLSRRAIENKSVLGEGGAAEERRRTGQAIYRKIFG